MFSRSNSFPLLLDAPMKTEYGEFPLLIQSPSLVSGGHHVCLSISTSYTLITDLLRQSSVSSSNIEPGKPSSSISPYKIEAIARHSFPIQLLQTFLFVSVGEVQKKIFMQWILK